VTPPSVVGPLFVWGNCGVQHESGFYCPIGGTVTDGPWGSGFNPYWSQVQVYYKDVTTQLCLDDSSINNTGLYAYTCPREGRWAVTSRFWRCTLERRLGARAGMTAWTPSADVPLATIASLRFRSGTYGA
jgi:hypothetical protein